MGWGVVQRKGRAQNSAASAKEKGRPKKEKAPAKPGRTSLQKESYHTSNRLVKTKISFF